MLRRTARLRNRPTLGMGLTFSLLIAIFLGAVYVAAADSAPQNRKLSSTIRTVDPDEPTVRPTRRILPAIKIDRSISVSPARIDLSPAQPGHKYEVVLRIRNKREFATKFVAEPLGVVAPTDPTKAAEYLSKGDKRETATAKSWIRPATNSFTLKSKEEIMLPVRILVPANASAGGNYAALTIRTVATPSKTGPAAVGVLPKVAVLLLATVPGNVHYDFAVKSVKAKSLIIGHPNYPIVAKLLNSGNTHERVIGKVRVKSILGQTVAQFPIRSRLMLPKGTAEAKALWKGTPWLGLYTIDISLNPDRSEKPHVVKTVRVVALPPWWLNITAGIVAAALLLWHRKHRHHNSDNVSESEH